MQTLSEQIGGVSSLLGLLLALDTLFTTEQARRIAEERNRVGGARRGAMRVVLMSSVALAVVTAAAIAVLSPLAVGVAGSVGEREWEPVFGVFGLVYLLLICLLAWQAALAVRAASASVGA